MSEETSALMRLRTRLEDERRRLVMALAADPVLSFLPMLSGVQAALDAIESEPTGPKGNE